MEQGFWGVVCDVLKGRGDRGSSCIKHLLSGLLRPLPLRGLEGLCIILTVVPSNPTLLCPLGEHALTLGDLVHAPLPTWNTLLFLWDPRALCYHKPCAEQASGFSSFNPPNNPDSK